MTNSEKSAKDRAEYLERLKDVPKSVARGSTIIMDRASFHRKESLENLARRHGVEILFLPAYSPDFNPIEKTKAYMKKTLIDALPTKKHIQDAMMQFFEH